MNATQLYRIATVIFVLFAAGHTVGFLRFKPATPEGAAVREVMGKVSFPVGKQSFTYEGFYRGFGLTISVYLLFMAYLSWHLGEQAAKGAAAVGNLGWMLAVLQVACLALSWLYFFPVTVVLAAMLTVCLTWAAMQVR